MEYLREAVQDYIRPFRDSDLVVKRRWFRVPEGTPFLPFPTAFYSGRWEPFPYFPRDVGVVYPLDPTYLKPQTLAGFTLKHYCGTADDFARGAVFDPDFRQEYDADWIPTCCGRIGVCVFNLCFLGTLNDWPTSLLTTYPVTQQSAVDTTPALTSQLAVNGGNTSPPTAQWTVEFRPGGAISPFGLSVVTEGDTAGNIAQHTTTVRTDADTATTQRTTSTGWRVDFETVLDTANFRLEWVARVLTLKGDNLAIDPALLPPPPPPPPPTEFDTGELSATGTDQASAAPIVNTVTHVFTDSDGKGIILPTADQQMLFIIVDVGSSEAGCKLYPASGEVLNGTSADAPIDIGNSQLWIAKALGTGTGEWNVYPLTRGP